MRRCIGLGVIARSPRRLSRMNVTSWGMRVDLTIAHFDRGQFGMGVFNGARKLSRVAGASGSDF
jgi:hypothetical protein